VLSRQQNGAKTLNLAPFGFGPSKSERRVSRVAYKYCGGRHRRLNRCGFSQCVGGTFTRHRFKKTITPELLPASPGRNEPCQNSWCVASKHRRCNRPRPRTQRILKRCLPRYRLDADDYRLIWYKWFLFLRRDTLHERRETESTARWPSG